LIVVAAAPSIVLALFRPDVIALRYFLIGIAFYLLAVSDGLSQMWHGHRWGREIVFALLICFVVGNGVHAMAFLREGRGSYLAPLELIAQSRSGEGARLGSDQDFRNRKLLDFYRRHLPGDTDVHYFERGHWPEEGLDWLLLHTSYRDSAPAPHVKDDSGYVYALERSYGKFGASGFYIDLYRRIGRAHRQD